MELVDTLDLGSSAARRESSSLSARTKQRKNMELDHIYSPDRIMSELVQGKTLKTDDGTLYKINYKSGYVCWSRPGLEEWYDLGGHGWACLFEDEIFYEHEQAENNHDS